MSEELAVCANRCSQSCWCCFVLSFHVGTHVQEVMYRANGALAATGRLVYRSTPAPCQRSICNRICQLLQPGATGRYHFVRNNCQKWTYWAACAWAGRGSRPGGSCTSRHLPCIRHRTDTRACTHGASPSNSNSTFHSIGALAISVLHAVAANAIHVPKIIRFKLFKFKIVCWRARENGVGATKKQAVGAAINAEGC